MGGGPLPSVGWHTFLVIVAPAAIYAGKKAVDLIAEIVKKAVTSRRKPKQVNLFDGHGKVVKRIKIRALS
jgi:hypothetical protein